MPLILPQTNLIPRSSFLVPRQNNSRIIPSKPEGIAEDMAELTAFSTYGGDDAVRHRMREAEVRRNETVVHGEQTDDRLDAA